MNGAFRLSVLILAIFILALASSACSAKSEKKSKDESSTESTTPVSAPISKSEKEQVEKASKTDFSDPKSKSTVKVKLIELTEIDGTFLPENTKSTLKLGIREARAKYKQVIVARITKGKESPVYVIWRKNPGGDWKPTD